ncbi:hypothetical protein SUGI_0833590 [Cryptomeria japonica]|nr:hypothetical protein SUGI_0833590 [Cryptomeria japonica]
MRNGVGNRRRKTAKENARVSSASVCAGCAEDADDLDEDAFSCEACFVDNDLGGVAFMDSSGPSGDTMEGGFFEDLEALWESSCSKKAFDSEEDVDLLSPSSVPDDGVNVSWFSPDEEDELLLIIL